MAAAITQISPGRGRPLDVVDIIGTGFSPTSNAVTFDGVPAAISVQGETLVRVTVPGALAGFDRHAVVELTNLDDASVATWWWWAKPTVAAVATAVLPVKVPGFVEEARGLGRTIKNMATAEARYFERLASKVELLKDLLDAKGNLATKAAAPAGLRQALAGLASQVLVSALAGGQFQDREVWTLQWGLQMITGTGQLVQAMVPNCVDVCTIPTDDFLNFDNVAPVSGQIALLSLRERASATSRINRVEVLLDDVVVYDRNTLDGTFPGLGIRNGQHATFYPGVLVTQGQRVSVRITRNNDTTTVNVLAYLVVV